MAGKKFNKSAITSGVQPLELRFSPVFNPTSKECIAFRTKTVVYSLDLGTLTEPDYAYAVDHGNKTGIRLSEWNISEAASYINRLSEKYSQFTFVTAKCTSSFAELPDAVDRVENIVKSAGLENPSMLCLEFPQTLLYLANDNAEKTVMGLKRIGVKTMLSGCGSIDCPISKIMNVPVDYALLDPDTTALVHDRNKPDVLNKFCQYLKSMHVLVFADGVENDSDIFALRRMDVRGVIPAESYSGNFEETEGNLTFEEICSIEGETDG